jgi:Holliday junction resolvasome RuvABC DNA-binding subunit
MARRWDVKKKGPFRYDIDKIDIVPGVGRKVAERIVRELSENLAELKPVIAGDLREDDRKTAVLDEAVSALVNLGYNQRGQACGRLPGTFAESEAVGTIIRQSLAPLSGQR